MRVALHTNVETEVDIGKAAVILTTPLTLINHNLTKSAAKIANDLATNSNLYRGHEGEEN